MLGNLGNKEVKFMNHSIFDDVNHALVWATEHLRRKSFPKISNIYKEDVSALGQESSAVKKWSGHKANLPTDGEEAMLLAMKVYRFVRALKPAEQQLILLRYWGDYHSPQYLKGALQIKEVMRQRGHHVRLNYRFSYQQVGVQQNIHYKKAEREIKRILGELETKMSEKGLLPQGNKVPVSNLKTTQNKGRDWSLEVFCPQ